MTTKFPSKLCAVLLLGVGVARSIEELAKWWTDNNHHIRALPEDERARVIAAKDRRKEELS